MLALSRLLGLKERSQIEMTTVEMAACNEAMIDILDKLPEDLWIIAQRVNGPVGRRSGHIMEIYVSGTHGCGVAGAARALGIAYTSVEMNGFWEQSFELDGVKVYQLTDAGEQGRLS